MIKYIINTICACLVIVSFNVNAALVERLGGLAYYDTESNLTWLADAGASGGNLNWSESIAWATELNVAGVTGWRLPNSPWSDQSCDLQNGGLSLGYNCTGSEMGNLFYNVLGGVAGMALVSTHNANYDLFSNIVNTRYWSSEEYDPPFQHNAIYLDMANGNTYYGNQLSAYEVWAVFDGDVSAVPIPPAIWLFSSGILCILGMVKRKK